MTSQANLSIKNMKSTMDSVILSAIHDFGAQIAKKIIETIPKEDTKSIDAALIGVFMEMSEFLKSNDIDIGAEYFKHWNQLFKDGGSC